MKKLNKTLIKLVILLFFCAQLEAMDQPLPILDKIVRLNIGGQKIDTSRSTIELSGGDFLNALISGKFKIEKDEDDRIFIDRDGKEAKLVAYFIRNQQLPEKFDRKVAKSAADFFGIAAMSECANENEAPMTSLMKFQYLKECPHCPSRGLSGEFSEYSSAIQHFVNEHRAEMFHQYYGKRDDWGFLYRLPEKQ